MRKQTTPALAVAVIVVVVLLAAFLFWRAALGPPKRSPGSGVVGQGGKGEPVYRFGGGQGSRGR